jgi:ABC-type antimicrobial peptide transport system permease subunit
MTDVSTAVRALIQPRVPARPVGISSLASQIERSLFKERLMVILTTIFSTLALSLAAIGLYGLMSYSVTSRTREIGVRLALGARPSHVLRMVLGAAIRMVGAGLVVGLPLALLLSRLVQGMMFGVAPTDPATMASAVVVLALVGVAAAAVPARRAARLDPVTSIHVE